MALLVVLVGAFVVLHLITVAYVAYVPGEALPANGPHGAVTVDGRHVGAGDIYLVTIAEQSRVSEWDKLTAGWLHKDWQLIPTKAVTGGLSNAQYNQQNAQEMTDSQEYAKVAALRRLGYRVPEHGDGGLVIAVNSGEPATGKFQAGDVITDVDGKTISVAGDVGTQIRAAGIGTEMSFTVRRKSGNVVLHAAPVACGAACPADPQRPIIGVAVQTDNQSFTFPPGVNLSISTQGIGGPSAGLAFTLGSLDSLTSHELTGGKAVAATGTIDPTGLVGDVGGVTQKTITVYREGAKYFIVPMEEAADARKAAEGHHLTVVPVATLQQALDFLQSIGGNLTGIPAAPGTTTL
ncbi:MAG TPA: PDZ domain-containing protein [Acidimicrobiales bacterium]|nr:PDZ domain-containing protein [Acidimicrobiales bacterium]